MQETCIPNMIYDFIATVGWAICSTYHTVLGTTSGVAIVGQGVLFVLTYIPDWSGIGKPKQQQVNQSNKH